ncbi:hypothetical protein JB92DRAFT_3127903 [Gautieria morchelliformis]|nr:hypothetical protein JB92DRAFT_3127903 [Gautieria morchelliformis]
MLLSGGGIGHSKSQYSSMHKSPSPSAPRDASVEPLYVTMEILGTESAPDSPLHAEDGEHESNSGEDNNGSQDEDSLGEETEDELESDDNSINFSDDGYGSP